MEDNTENLITVKILKEFLEKLPKEFDSYPLVNGEVGELDGEYYIRIDKPVVQISVDEETKEFLILNQTSENMTDIINSINKQEDGNP